MQSDIVARLREEGFVTHIAQLPRESKLLHEAADEIERLRNERDEARRRVCEDAIRYGRIYRRVERNTVQCETPQEVAEIMLWNCYRGAFNEQ